MAAVRNLYLVFTFMVINNDYSGERCKILYGNTT